jgi:hypothetical protein
MSRPGRTVWLASFPKSGNTWVRAVITALGTHHHLFGVNQLDAGWQPHHVGAAVPMFGMDPRWLDADELTQLRTALILREDADRPTEDAPPLFRKTHETYRSLQGRGEPFPTQATRAAILIVRDPRQVACSYAPFFGKDLDQSIDLLGTDQVSEQTSPAMMRTAQPWGSWSSHAGSWTSESVPFPVRVIRYEDLSRDPLGTLLPVLRWAGLAVTEEEVVNALETAAFQRLRESEAEQGFRERGSKTQTFFRQGAVDSWRTELSTDQVVAIEADHGEQMVRLGYELTTTPNQRRAVAAVRDSRRRQRRHGWLHLPARMGIEVVEEDVPEILEGAQRPRPWIQVTPDRAIVRFSGGAALMVADGRRVSVSWRPDPAAPDEDPSWLVQGWAVTLAMLQRGDLSLHAATVRVGSTTVAIAGNRGAGKSTTSMGLRARGHDLLIDDVTLIEFRQGRAWTTPYSRNVHLLADAAASFDLEFDAMPRLAGGRVKVAFRPEDPSEVPHLIDRIIVLDPAPAADGVTIAEARGSQRLAALTAHTRRDGIAPLVLGQQRYFELLAKLADTVPVAIVRRPRGQSTLDEVLDLIEDALEVPSPPATGEPG